MAMGIRQRRELMPLALVSWGTTRPWNAKLPGPSPGCPCGCSSDVIVDACAGREQVQSSSARCGTLKRIRGHPVPVIKEILPAPPAPGVLRVRDFNTTLLPTPLRARPSDGSGAAADQLERLAGTQPSFGPDRRGRCLRFWTWCEKTSPARMFPRRICVLSPSPPLDASIPC